MFSARHEFPSEWHRFLYPTNTDARQTLQLKLAPERFPFQHREKTIEIQQLDLFMKFSDEEVEKKYRGEGGTGNVTSAPLTVYLRAPGASSVKDAKLESDDDFLSGVAYATVRVTHKPKSTDPPWEIEAQSVDIEKMNDDLHDSTTVGGASVYRLKPDVVEDLLVVCHYSVVQST
jgi:hypothetical protein